MNDIDKTFKNLNELAKQRQKIYDKAYQLYTDAVNSTTAVLVPDEQQVGEIFEGLLTFCDDKRFTELYKKLCRHVIALYPELADNYIQLYHSKYEATESGQNQKKTSRQKSSGGIAHIFLKTDLMDAVLTPIEKMDKLQRQIFKKMNPAEQQKILEGYPSAVVNLENGGVICQFNMENFCPPKHAIESFARRILPDIQEAYSHEENRREFEEWKKRQEKDSDKSK